VRFEEFMSIEEQGMPRESEWRWPREPDWLQSARDRAAAMAEERVAGLPRRIDVEPDRPLMVYTPRPEDRGAEWAS
jgi:hypothetical protein